MTNLVTKPSNAIAAACRATWTDHTTGRFSLVHFGSVVTIGILSTAFMKNVALGKVDGLDYIYFALAMALSASPALARMVIVRVWPAQPQGGNGYE